MSLLRRLLRINLKKIDSDFVSSCKRFKNKDIFFVDLGCRGEDPKYWFETKDSIKYIGIDASEAVINELKSKYKKYSGNIIAFFKCAIVSNNTAEQTFATSSEGMCDGIIIDRPADNISAKDINFKKVKPISLASVLHEYEDYLMNKNHVLKILKIDIEGNSSSIVDNKELVGQFDIVLAEILPQLKNQFATMSLLEENNFKLKNIERAYKWGKSSTKELFIIDTEWINNNSKFAFENRPIRNPNLIMRTFSLVVFILISWLFKLIRGKAYSSVSDSELGW